MTGMSSCRGTMEHGHHVIGQTLESLADYAWTEHQNRAPGEWHPERGRPVDLSGYGHIMIPMPEENE